jgi:hypothetical protein
MQIEFVPKNLKADRQQLTALDPRFRRGCRGTWPCRAVQISHRLWRSMRLRRLLCGRAMPFRPSPHILSSSTPPGRHSLPGGVEELSWWSPATERRSLSAQQAAEPHVAPQSPDGNLDKPGFAPPSLRRRSAAGLDSRLRGNDDGGMRAVGGSVPYEGESIWTVIPAARLDRA